MHCHVKVKGNATLYLTAWQTGTSWTAESMDIAKCPRKEGHEALQTSKMGVQKDAGNIVYNISNIISLLSNKTRAVQYTAKGISTAIIEPWLSFFYRADLETYGRAKHHGWVDTILETKTGKGNHILDKIEGSIGCVQMVVSWICWTFQNNNIDRAVDPQSHSGVSWFHLFNATP